MVRGSASASRALTESVAAGDAVCGPGQVAARDRRRAQRRDGHGSSVRYAGQRIRVTIQLIDPGTDLHLISETYNADISDLDEIFEIQSDIAMRVANALQAEFSPREQARIEQMPTDSPEAWREYLAARAFNDLYTAGSFLSAIEHIDRAFAGSG